MILVTIALGLCFVVFLYWFLMSVIDQLFEDDVKICYRPYQHPGAPKSTSIVDNRRAIASQFSEKESRIVEVRSHPKSA